MTRKRQRIRRPKPARTAPNRDFSTVLQRGPSITPSEPTAGGSAGAKRDALSDVVAEGTKLGYSVIQEQIRQGRLIAQQWSQVGRGSDGGIPDFSHLLQRMIHLSTDLGALLVDATGMVTRPQSRAPGPEAQQPGGNGFAVDATSSRPNTPLSIDIQARGKTRVTLDLAGWSAHENLKAPALYSLEGNSAPLTSISFARETVRIEIPEEQPPGTYTGVVVDGRTNEPRGTLSVRLAE